jgi:predicted AAA+ superfamily ATPase
MIFIRYFFEQRPELAVICAGSLLEFILEDHDFSMPVGRIEFLHLGPMKFSEFLMNGNKSELLGQVTENFQNLKSFHYEQLTDQIKKYFFVGGMPEAVQTYFNTHSPISVRDVHHSIISTYKNDFSKYSNKKDLPRIEEIFEALPINLGKKIKYTQFSMELDARKIKKSLHLLGLARLIHFCYHSNSSGIPLSSQKDPNVFKLYFLDVGLMHYLLGLHWKDLNEYDDKSLLTQGLAAEQFVAQHLAYRRGPQDEPELYYWLRDKNAANAEVDFVISKGHSIFPIEVKSGQSGSIKSLIQFIIEKKYLSAYRLDLRDRSMNTKNISEKISINSPNAQDGKIYFELQNLHLGMIEILDNKSASSDDFF